MNITVSQLKTFLKVAELQSVTKAADELALTQPAVSIQLKNFQDQFSIPLTEVVGRNLHITEFGREIALIAERAINEMNALNHKTVEFNGLLAGTLRISSASTGKYVIPYFLSGFLKEHKGIDLRLDVTNKSMVMDSLKRNEIDFAIVSVLPGDLEVNEELLIENRLFLVGPNEALEHNNSLIYREQGSATRQVMEAYFKNNKKLTDKKLELTSNEAVKQAIVAGLGVSIVPLIGIHNELDNGTLRIIQRKGLPICTDWRLIWLKSKTLSPVANAFLNYMKDNKQSIIDRHFGWYDNYS